MTVSLAVAAALVAATELRLVAWSIGGRFESLFVAFAVIIVGKQLL